MGTVDAQKVYTELRALRKEVASLREHIIDQDAVLTPEEAAFVQKARSEIAAGDFVPHEEVKRRVMQRR